MEDKSMDHMLIDSFGRTINNLRVSVTDQCNFRCIYCMPEEGMVFQPKEEILTFEEITRVIRIVSTLGVSKIRLTGGEPTVRKDLPLLISMISEIPGIKDMAMTTNGFFLKKMSRALREAGLPRINVSLDTLDEEKFKQMTRRDVLHKVIEGLEEATRYFQLPIKINVVAMKGYTEDDILDFALLARTKPYQIRFIEFMPLDADRTWSRDQVLTGKEIIDRIDSKWPRRAQYSGKCHQSLYQFYVPGSKQAHDKWNLKETKSAIYYFDMNQSQYDQITNNEKVYLIEPPPKGI